MTARGDFGAARARHSLLLLVGNAMGEGRPGANKVIEIVKRLNFRERVTKWVVRECSSYGG